MPQSEPSFINQMQRYLPPCSKCGAATTLVRIEPSSHAGHDVRTFNCTVCPNADTVETRFR
jgi:hypothetical protein